MLRTNLTAQSYLDTILTFLFQMLSARVHVRRAKQAAINNIFSTTGDGDNRVEAVMIPDGNLSEVDDGEPDERPDVVIAEEEQPATIAEDDADVPNPEYVFRWRRRQPLTVNFRDFEVDEEVGDLTPYQMFKEVFTDELLQLITDESNRYSVEQTGESINASFGEYEAFFGRPILLFSTIMDACEFRMYWRADLRWSAVADAMPLKRFESLKRFFHLSDNAKAKPHDDPGCDPLHKIRPLLDHILSWCKTIEPTQHQSIDEMMVPFKGRIKIRQYMPKKPSKWGFKIFARCSDSGIVHDFSVYCGSKTQLGKFENYPDVGFGGRVVLHLCDSLPDNKDFKVFFDNYFSSPELVLILKNTHGIHSVGTIRTNRMKGCPLKTEKELKLSGRGSSDMMVDGNSSMIMVRWYDNRAVSFVSSYAGIEASSTVKRWSRNDKRNIEIDCPFVVREYNKFMGGVDLMDMLLSLHRVDRKSTKWYMRLVFHLLGITLNNLWLLSRRRLYESTSKSLSLREFIIQIASGCVDARKPKNIVSKRSVLTDVRYDGLCHFPQHQGRRLRCKREGCGGTSVWECGKCSLTLCLSERSNCFTQYHIP